MNPVSILIQSTLCFGVAALALLVFRRSPQARVFICRLAMVSFVVACIATPRLVSPFRTVPALPETNPVVTNQVEKPASSTSVSKHSEIIEPTLGSVAPSDVNEKLPRAFEVDWGLVAGILYLTGVVIGLGSLIGGLTQLLGIVNRSVPVVESQVVGLVARRAQQMKVRKPRLRSSAEIASPCVTGLFRPTLLMPDFMLADDLEAVIDHELCHLRNRDVLWLLVTRLMCIAFWCQPFVWVIERAHRIATEERCDMAVIESGASAPAYASTLVGLQEASQFPIPLPGVGVVSGNSNLGRRVRAILEPSWRRFGIGSRLMALLAIGCVGGLSALLFAQPGVRGQVDFGTIRAVDEGGKPVVLKWAQAYVWAQSIPETKTLQLATRGDRIEIGKHQWHHRTVALMCEAEDGRVDTAYLIDDRPVDKFIFHKTSTIRGRVVLPGGNDGTLRARLWLVGRDRRDEEGSDIGMPIVPSLPLAKTVPIDKEGKFEMSGIPVGSDPEIEIDDDRFYKVRTSPKSRVEMDGSSKPIVVEFGWSGHIEGRLTNHGVPIAGTWVGAQMERPYNWGHAVTDADGKYRISRIAPGKYNLAVLEKEVGAVRARVGVEVPAKVPVRDVDLTTEVGGYLEGQILKYDGSPDSGARVGVYGPAHPRTGGWVDWKESDVNGRFRFHVPTGENFVYSMNEPKVGQTVRISQDQTTKVTLQFPKDTFGNSPFEFLFTDSQAIAVDIPETRFLGSDQPTHALLGGLVDIRTATPVIWHPDGTRVPMSPALAKAIQDWLKKFNRFDSRMFAMVRMTSLPCDQDRFIFGFGHTRGSGEYHGANKTAPLMVPISMGEGLARADLRVGIPAELPKTVFKGKADQLMRPMKQVPGMPHYQLRLGAYAKDKDWSLTMDLEDGRAFHAVGYGDNETVVIGMTPKDKLRNVSVTARKVGWATFNNVALRPKS